MISTKLLRGFTYSKSIVNTALRLENTSRHIQSSAIKCVKMFMEHENKYAYNIMETKGYAISLELDKVEPASPLTEKQFSQATAEDWSKRPPGELFKYFSLFGQYCTEHKLCISNKVFDNFIDCLTDNLRHASDKDLESIFYSLTIWPEVESVRTRNYIEVWAALDDQCMHRLQSWSFDEILDFISLFFMLNVTRVSDFSKKALQKLTSKAKQLTSAQIVQTMFFIGVQRRQPFDMHNMELHMNNIFEEFTVDDLAIMSMGFFKSKTPIRSMELVTKIINKVIDNPKYIHEISLAALVKVIRYSMKITRDDQIYKLLDVLLHEVPRLSVMCNVHIALLGTATLTFHQECLVRIAERIMTTMHNARLKDLERLVLTYATFNFKPQTKECFFQTVIEELRSPEKQSEIEKHGRSFISCIEYLGIVEFYPVDLMNKALNPEYLEHTFGKYCYLYGRSVLAVHNTAEIFCEGAEINRLTTKVARILAKKYTDYVPDEDYNKKYNVSERMFIDVCNTLKDCRGGNDFVVADHILTHHQRGDIIICNDNEGVPQPVQGSFSNENFGLLRRPPNGHHWIVLIIAGRNAIIHNSNTPSGHFHAKVRELNALGFHAALVPWSIYTTIKTKEDKINYLNILIKDAVKYKLSS